MYLFIVIATVACNKMENESNIKILISDYSSEFPIDNYIVWNDNKPDTICKPSYHVFVNKTRDSTYCYIKLYQFYNDEMPKDINLSTNKNLLVNEDAESQGWTEVEGKPVIIFDSSNALQLDNSILQKEIPKNLMFNQNNCHINTRMILYSKNNSETNFVRTPFKEIRRVFITK